MSFAHFSSEVKLRRQHYCHGTARWWAVTDEVGGRLLAHGTLDPPFIITQAPSVFWMPPITISIGP